MRQSVADNLASAQQMFSSVEARRQQEVLASVATLAENPTLKAALDTWLTERHSAATSADELLATVQREADKIAGAHLRGCSGRHRSRGARDRERRAAARRRGRAAHAWAPFPTPQATSLAIATDGQVFRVSSVTLELQDASVGSLRLGTALSDGYAHDIALLSRGEAAIILNGRVLASTLPAGKAAALASSPATRSQSAQKVDLLGESWAVQPLLQIGDVQLLALASIDLVAARETQVALASLGWIALGAMSLAVLGSVWLARTLTQPIDQLSRTIASMADNRVSEPLPPGGASRELDQLAATFNPLMASRAAAEAEAEATYLGAVRALAAALDARDPYTAGHSERVSTLAVAMGEEMGLDADAIETLRLGALLHDIGKIGVPDEVLRKRGRLTAAEFDAIKTHPSAGARILRSIPFLAPHIPIVELHHERPDGLGYPYGLQGRRDSARRAHRARGRCVRRDDQRARVPLGAAAVRGHRRTAPLHRHRLRRRVGRGVVVGAHAPGRWP